MRRSVAIGALALLLSGCFWQQPGQGPNRQGYNASETTISPANVPGFHQLWDASVDEGAVGDPVTSANGVHVNDLRTVYAFDTGSGERLWTYTVAAPGNVEQPWVRGDHLRVGQRVEGTAWPFRPEGQTVVLDAATGGVRGPVGTNRPAALRGTNQVAWVNIYYGRVVRWFDRIDVIDVDTQTRICCSGFMWSVSNDDWPAPTPSFTLGSRWVFHAGQGIIDPADPLGPTGNGNGLRAYEVTLENRSCPDPVSHYLCPSWAVAPDGTTATVPVLSDDESVVYVGTDAGTVYAVDVATQAVLWSASVGSAVTDSPALAYGSLFVPTASGDLVVLAASDGSPLWTGATGSKISQQPAVAGGVVFTGSLDGTVTGFDAAGCGGAAACSPLWSESTGSEITGAPAVNRGRLYVGTADGHVVAYGL